MVIFNNYMQCARVIEINYIGLDVTVLERKMISFARGDRVVSFFQGMCENPSAAFSLF